jgi:hypothetical protein
MKKLLTLFILICFLKISSQNIIKVSSTGVGFISGKVSPDEAKIEALNDAKLNALRAAGITEQLSNYNLLFSAQKNNDFAQFFNSSTQSEMQGAISSYTVISEKTIQKNQNELVIEIKLDAEIIKYKSKLDVEFDAKISGIEALYKAGQHLNFKIDVTKNCYLTIFNIIEGTQGVLMYPQATSKSLQLVSNKSYEFPNDFDKENDYYLETELKNESNQLIFVFTKSKIDFIKSKINESIDSEKMFTWIYRIPPDQRKVEYIPFSIFSKNK